MTSPLRRNLGLAAVIAVVMGDMLGSGIFFTPGALAQIAAPRWGVDVIWSRWGLVVRAGCESHAAAQEIGDQVVAIRYAAVMFGGALAGLGGAY